MAKKKVKEQPNTLDLARKTIEKKYGFVMGVMSDPEYMNIKTISSGSLGLDIALGRGGFARGRMYEIYGPPSGGKTTLSMSVIAEAQRRGMSAVFCDAENAADPTLFTAMGVDIEKLQTVKAFSGDDNLDALEIILKTGAIDVAVVDSVSALIPKAEAEAEIGQDFMGLLARLMSKATRRFAAVINETNTLLIFINQIRMKIGAYGDPRTTTGGEALPFYCTGRIAVAGGESKKSRIVNDITGEVIGHNTKFEIKKNKLAPPFRSAEIPLIYGSGYDLHAECLDLSTQLGLLERRGSWYSYDGENFANGAAAAIEYLHENPDFYDSIRNQVIEMTGLKEAYEQHS
jgi:recombination protein RecA